MIRALQLCSFVAITALAQQQQPADPALKKGLESYRSGDCSAAIPLLEASANPARASLPLSRCYIEGKEFAKAQAVLTRYRQLAPDDELGVVLLARSLQLGGNADGAIAALEPFIKQFPDSIGARNAMAALHLASSRRPQAEAMYQSVLKVQPSDPSALIGLGNLLAADGKWQEAARLFQRVIQFAPSNSDALYGMGSAQLQLGNTDAALPFLERAALLRPDDWDLAKLLAGAQMKAGKWQQMVQTLEFHSQEHAAEQRVTGWMGEAFQRINQPARAEEYYKAILRRAGSNLSARLLLGNLFYESKRLPEAKTEYLAALKLKPELPEVSDRMGQMAEKDGNMPEARDYYDAACTSPNATVDMKMRLARAYFATDEAPKSRVQLESVLRAEPQNREAKSMLARVASKTAQWDEAARLSGDLLAEDRRNTMLLRIWGEALFRRKNDADLPKAQEAMQAVISADPADRGAKLILAQIEAKNEQWDEAARYARELLINDRNNLELLRLMTQSSLKRNREAEATEFLEQVIALDQDDRDARFQLVRLYLKIEALNRIPRALELMKDYVKKHSDDAEGYLLLATLHRRKAEPDEAHEFFVRGFEKVPTQIPAHLSWAYSDFGKMLLQEGKLQDALTYQLKAVEMSPNDDDALLTLGLIYFQLNKDEDLKGVREKLTQMSSPLLPVFEDQTAKKNRPRPAVKKK